MDFVHLFYTKAIPVGLIIVMAGMGLSLTLADIKRVVVMPGAAALGLGGQLVLLPLLGFLIAGLVAPTPAVAVGLIVLAACPGGATSNAYVFASRADVALSVMLTAIGSFITVFTIPLLIWLALQLHYQSGDIPGLHVPAMIGKLAKLTVLPVVLGMICRARWPAFSLRLVEPMRTVALWFLILLIVGGTITAWDSIRANFLAVCGSAAALNLSSMGLGFILARAAGLPLPQVISITYEMGVQNIAVAMLVAYTLLGKPELATVALVYALLMKVTALGLLVYARSAVGGIDQLRRTPN